MSCCPEDGEPFLAESAVYEPKGKKTNLENGMEAYLVGPESSDSCVVVFADVYGFDSGRHKEFCDNIADKGHFVVMPDLFRGRPPFVSDRDSRTGFDNLMKHCKFSDLKDDIVGTVFPFCKQKSRKVGCLGFCYGAYLWMMLATVDSVRFDACASPHPSIVRIATGTHEDWRGAVKNLKCPVMMLNAGNDPPEQAPGGEIDTTLKELNAELHKKHVFATYPDCNHGWTVRGNMKDEKTREATVDAFRQIVAFFDEHLAADV